MILFNLLKITGFGQNFEMILSGRVISGLATGMTTVVVPTYIGEFASPEYRGMLGKKVLLNYFQKFLNLWPSSEQSTLLNKPYRGILSPIGILTF